MLNSHGKILYIGKAKHLDQRLRSYLTLPSTISSKQHALISQIAHINYVITADETEALLLEEKLIKAHRPRYNVSLRDDKVYPFIHLSDTPFPSFQLYRGTQKRTGRYFGPYPIVNAARDTLQLLQKLFLIRSCRDSQFRNRSRPCLQHQIQRCSAPCVGLCSPQHYAQAVQQALWFLEGKNQTIIDDLAQKMQAAADHLAFEEAAHYRDQIRQLQKISSQHSTPQSPNLDNLLHPASPLTSLDTLNNWYQERFTALHHFLCSHPTLALSESQRAQLPPHLNHIDCFDVSHFQGQATVAVCVTFGQTGPQTAAYRRYNISDTTPGDDNAALAAALSRHYQHSQHLPDLLLIDGGLPQLNTAHHISQRLSLSIPLIIGIAKGPQRRPGLETLFLNNGFFQLPADSPILHLLQRIRDEAHRFAIHSHRKKLAKLKRTSILQNIPGIGPQRRKRLLNHFGGLQGVLTARIEDLMHVPGINRHLATQIYEFKNHYLL